jgi:hypothetical protein
MPKEGNENIFKPKIENECLDEISNDNGVKAAYYGTSKIPHCQECNLPKSQQSQIHLYLHLLMERHILTLATS